MRAQRYRKECIVQKITSKEFIERELFRLTVATRIGIEDGEFTEEEAKELIADVGGKMFNKVLSLTDDEFMLLKLKELTKMLEERSVQR